ncbi:hypothetical protein YC2023_066353 [Brassica napus]
METHRQTQTATDVLCVLTDTHKSPVCADGHPRTATSVLCVLADTHRRPPTWAKITRTVHGKGQRAESKDQRADMCTDGQTIVLICVLMDSHGRPVCADGHTQTHTDTHDILCVLADTHRRPVCTEQTAHVGKNHPNSPREGSAC